MPIKIHNVKKDIEVDVEARFHTNNYSKEDNRPLPISWNKKLIGLMKDELNREIIKKFSGTKSYMHTLSSNIYAKLYH